MHLLFIHQNFPGQFKSLAPALAADSNNLIVAMTMHNTTVREWQGVKLVHYSATRGSTPGIHPWLIDFETKVIRAEACFRAALKLRDQGFTPDVIIAHPGWGESLFLKDVWPQVQLGLYCEFYYRLAGADMNFDPEFSCTDPGEICRLKVKNINNIMQLERMEAGISPTFWQASTFPEPFRSKITVVHDGIDTRVITPNAHVSLTLNKTLPLTRDNEVITFVNRHLEPYRGYHIFMRALPKILKNRPKAHVLLVGGDGVSYGMKPTGGSKWRDIFVNEVRPYIADTDWTRVHFLGNVPYNIFISVLQLSTVHVYLTYPFVLSWSLLEAMSAGCAVVASDTPPLREAIFQDETGRLVNFFDIDGLAETVCILLDDPASRKRLGTNAREFAYSHYDLKTICLPSQLKWISSLAVSGWSSK